ncbi:MAG TPA: acyl-[acyl-carrier-protein]--UDP-N-acetylglucosamine O-acyltransferase, partial [Gammaproteobacteria bacterium]
MIDPRAIVSPKARLHSDVQVGPYAIIGDEVEIGRGTRIEAHAVVKGPTTIGEDNHIFQFASLGDDPQDKKYGGEPTRLVIGDRNTIREY